MRRLKEDAQKLAAENAVQREVIAELVAKLDRAHDDMAAWQAYASSYFQEKHGADDDLASIKEALDLAKQLEDL